MIPWIALIPAFIAGMVVGRKIGWTQCWKRHVVREPLEDVLRQMKPRKGHDHGCC